MNAPRDTQGWLRSASDLLAAFRSGEWSPVDAIARSLATVRTADKKLTCAISVLDDEAVTRAEESAARWRTGSARALEGVPFGIKDVFDLRGTVTTSGSRVHKDRRSNTTAVAVQRLLDAGAIPVSKDATTEWAVGGPHNLVHGPTRNPWDTTRWAGGSSMGSAAAVAAGAFPFALGTDAGGSIRIPAAYCGVTGLKPTSGLVPRTGATPLSWTTETVGSIAASAADAALMLQVIAGHDPLDAQSLRARFSAPPARDRLDGLRIGLPGRYFTDGCDAAVTGGFEALVSTVTALGATCVDVDIPSAEQAHVIGYQVLFTEAWAIHAARADVFGEYDPVALKRISRGSWTSAHDYLLMLSFRAQLQRELENAFEKADLLLMPGTPATAPKLDTLCVSINGTMVPMYEAQSRATMMCNLSGVPAVMIPSGLSDVGLPVAAQLVGRPLREDMLLSVAMACQAANGLMRLEPGAELPASSRNDL